MVQKKMPPEGIVYSSLMPDDFRVELAPKRGENTNWATWESLLDYWREIRSKRGGKSLRENTSWRKIER